MIPFHGLNQLQIQIGDRVIGQDKDTFVIAEAGVNHNGDIGRAFDLIRLAKQCGADCVKFQTFKAEEIVTLSAPKAPYQLEVTDKRESQYEMLKKLELSVDQFRQIQAKCREVGLLFLSTPYNFSDVEDLEDLGVDAYKIASAQLVEHPFLEYLAKKNKPIILSTGMSTMKEVGEAVNVLRGSGNDQIVILQCTTNYPSATEDANLHAMLAMQNAFNVLVGYSDHTENSYAILASVALGAVVVEKHFTQDRSLPGPDHSSSIEPDELEELVKGIRNVRKSLGCREKFPTPAERKNMSVMRRSIVAVETLEASTVIRKEHLAFKRPATGVAPKKFNELIGKKVKSIIYPDTPIREENVEW
jgi:N,N'-diacetyllegionaminate synthase